MREIRRRGARWASASGRVGRAPGPSPAAAARRRGAAATALPLLLLGLVLTACSTGANAVDATSGGSFGFVQQASGQDTVPVGDRKLAPTLVGPTLTDARLDVASLRGRVVVINFWASWCAPCRAETPQLVELAGKRPTVAFVGVDEKEDVSSARAFVRDFRVGYPSIVDKLGTLAAHWPVAPGLPSTFVLDKDGRIAARFTGGVVTDDLTPVLDRLAVET